MDNGLEDKLLKEIEKVFYQISYCLTGSWKWIYLLWSIIPDETGRRYFKAINNSSHKSFSDSSIIYIFYYIIENEEYGGVLYLWNRYKIDSVIFAIIHAERCNKWIK